MTPAGELLAAEIRRGGPIPFHRFMEAALYHPEHGYYRRPHDPFGKEGDFFTAEQIAAGLRHPDRGARPPALPRHGRAARLHRGRTRRGAAGDGAGACRVALRAGGSIRGTLPERFEGVVFSNEFFDALPVDVSVYAGGRTARAARRTSTARASSGKPAPPPPKARSTTYAATIRPPSKDNWYEVNLAALDWMGRIAGALERGYVLTRRLRLHARGGRAISRWNAHGLPPPHRARGCAGRAWRARHHRARQLHRARRVRHHPRIATRAGSRRSRRRCSPRARRISSPRRSVAETICAAACSSRRCCSEWGRRSGCSGRRRTIRRREA